MSDGKPADEKFLFLHENIFSKEHIGVTEKELERVYLQAKKLYEAGKYEDSKILFSILVLLESHTPAFLYGFASVCLMLKQYDEAIESFSEYAGLVPTDPSPYFFIASCYEKKRDLTSTLIALQTVINRCGAQTQYQELRNRAVLTLQTIQSSLDSSEKSSS
ncbi:MAG: hypothetical protein ACSNEK_00775 [Parachlamydiaceae bacterium]